nr:hypothetical protein [Tanacetum cinerariifolium]
RMMVSLFLLEGLEEEAWVEAMRVEAMRVEAMRVEEE